MRETHILDRLEPIYRYRYIAIAGVALAFGAAALQLRSGPAAYEARARLQVQQPHAAIAPGLPIPVIVARIVDQDRYFQVQIEMLRGRELAQRVVRAMGLRSPADLDLPPSASPATDISPQQLAALAAAVQARVGIQPMRESFLIDVTFRSQQARFAMAAVNTLAREYVAMNREANEQSRDAMIATLDKAVAEQADKIRATEQRMIAFADEHRVDGRGGEHSDAAIRLLQTSDALTRATVERVEKEAAYKRAQQATDATMDADEAMLARRADLEREHARLADRYGPSHPAMQAAEAQLRDMDEQIARSAEERRDTLRREYERARAEEQALARNLGAERSRAAAVGRQNADYTTLDRELTTERQVYESFLASRSALRLASRGVAEPARIIERADLPAAPVTPPRRNWLVTLLVGVVLALGATFALDYMNDTLRTPDEVTHCLGLPFLGFVPEGPSSNGQPLVAAGDTGSAFSEAIRAVRTALVAQVPSRGAGTLIAVTSTQPREGKTTTACNVAVALSLAGSRVLLIDADMRRPRVAEALNLSNDRGLSGLLQGNGRIRDVVQRSADPNLLIMGSGPPPPNPSELLMSSRMGALVESLRRSPFEWVVLDMPPVLAATDAAVVASMADALVFVVGAGVTRRRLARRAIETLRAATPRRICTILNKVDVARDRYYYSRHYGHGA